MCSEGSVHNFLNNMKLLKFALLIPPSTSGVECGFSIMNLLVSPLHKSISKNNIDQLMRMSRWTKISQPGTTRKNRRHIQR